MKKSVSMAIAVFLFVTSSVSAQGFFKKIGNAAKEVIKTEESSGQKASEEQTELLAPVAVMIKSTRIIGDRLLISGEIKPLDDVRISKMSISAVTPDGNIYKLEDMWWGGVPTYLSSFDKSLTSGINYAIDFTFDIKNKKITELATLTFEVRDWDAQENYKIPIKNMMIPVPENPELNNPCVIEIDKDIYLRWTGAEEKADGLKINFVIENKSDDDQELRFMGFTYMKATIVDTNGNSYETTGSLKCNTMCPAGIPVAGSITLDKPLKVSDISLLEFATKYFNYRIKKIVLPM